MFSNNFNKVSFVGLVLLSLAATNCGKDEKKKNGAGSSSKPTITSSKRDGQTASISFTAQGDTSNLKCRVLWANKEGQWTPCPSGTFSHTPQAGEGLFMLQARLGDGEVASQQFEVAPPPLPSPADIQNVQNGPNLTNLMLADRYTFAVPADMQLTRFATSQGVRSHLAYSIMDPSMNDLIPQTMCEKVGGAVPNETAVDYSIIPNALSTPSGLTAQYCAYRSYDDATFKHLERLQMARDQIEVKSLPGAPFQYITAAVYSDPQDAQNTNRLYNRLCNSNQRQAFNHQTFDNIPVLNNYDGLAGYERRGSVFYCKTDITTTLGTEKVRLDVLTFRIHSQRNVPGPCNDPRRPNGGFQCPSVAEIEYTYLIEGNDRLAQESAVSLVNRSLSTLRFYVRQ